MRFQQGIPFLQKHRFVFSQHALYLPKFDRTEVQVPGQRDRVKPEFRRFDRRDPHVREAVRRAHANGSRCDMAPLARSSAHAQYLTVSRNVEVAREARPNLGMHHLAEMCWVVSVFASKDNAELERLSSDEIRRSRWYHSKEILPLPTPPNGKYDVITDLRGHEDAFGTNR